MNNRTTNQQPTDDGVRRNDQSLARRDESQGQANYGGTGSSPFELMRRFSQDVDRMFTSFGFGSMGDSQQRSGTTGTNTSKGKGMTAWAPSVDVCTKGNDLVVSADLPGIKPDDIDVSVEGNNLIIRGESHTKQENKDQGYLYSERSYGSFYRSIPLPPGTSADKANAQFNNGVLEVTLPDAAKNKQEHRRIQVQGSNQQPKNTSPNQGAQNTQNVGANTSSSNTEQHAHAQT